MKLLVGLGNPGDEYKLNRHNVGFMFVEYFYAQINKEGNDTGGSFKSDKYLHGRVATLGDFIFLMPQTFMNESGIAVHETVKRHQLSHTDILVAHDDLDIPFGTFHIQVGRGPQLHNGLESIEKSLGTKAFFRIRIGVDNRDPEKRVNGERYVLENFTTDEQLQLQVIFQKVTEQLRLLKVY